MPVGLVTPFDSRGLLGEAAREDGWPSRPSVTRERNGQGPAVRVMLDGGSRRRPIQQHRSWRLATGDRPRTRHGHHLLRRISDATADPPARDPQRGHDRAGRGGRTGCAAGREAGAEPRIDPRPGPGAAVPAGDPAPGGLSPDPPRRRQGPSAAGPARHRAARAAPASWRSITWPPSGHATPGGRGGEVLRGARPGTRRAATTWPRPPGRTPFASTPSCPRRAGR